MKIKTPCFYCDNSQFGIPMFGIDDFILQDFSLCDKCLNKRKEIHLLKIGDR
jgi:hypothetical protein